MNNIVRIPLVDTGSRLVPGLDSRVDMLDELLPLYDNNPFSHTVEYRDKYFNMEGEAEVDYRGSFGNELADASVYVNDEKKFTVLYFNLNDLEAIRVLREQYGYQVFMEEFNLPAVRFKSMPIYGSKVNDVNYDVILLGSLTYNKLNGEYEDLSVYYYVRDLDLFVLDAGKAIVEECVNSGDEDISKYTCSASHPIVEPYLKALGTNAYMHHLADFTVNDEFVNVLNLVTDSSISVDGNVKYYSRDVSDLEVPKQLKKYEDSVTLAFKNVTDDGYSVYFVCTDEVADEIRELLELSDKYRYTHFKMSFDNKGSYVSSRGYLYRYNTALSAWVN
jgi:hypothetical protein